MWLLVGAIAGWLAGTVMSGEGFGIIGDIVVGLVGSVIGGWLFSYFMPNSSVGFVGSVVVAFVGAVLLVAIVRLLVGGGRRSRF
jgi:uncharacterized membrane protein YeaQ/YmgE (transglycosylase-associated protein family)